MSSNIEVEQSHTFTDKNEQQVNTTESQATSVKEEKKYNTPLTFVPFGKYAKIPFDDLVKITELKNGKLIYTGVSYLKWLNKQPWIKEELKTAMKPYVQ